MPSKDDIARFYAGENNWTKQQIAATEKMNALASLQWTDDEGPKTAEDYESRVSVITAAAEAIGYQVRRNVVPPHSNGTMTTLHFESLDIFNGPSNMIHSLPLRNGQDVSGVVLAEGWVRGEAGEKSRAEAKRQRMARDGARQLEAMEDADRAEDVTVTSLVKRVAELEEIVKKAGLDGDA